MGKERITKIRYPTKTYRVSLEVSRRLEILKDREDLSWNLLFKKLIDTYDQ